MSPHQQKLAHKMAEVDKSKQKEQQNLSFNMWKHVNPGYVNSSMSTTNKVCVCAHEGLRSRHRKECSFLLQANSPSVHTPNPLGHASQGSTPRQISSRLQPAEVTPAAAHHRCLQTVTCHLMKLLAHTF